MQINLFHRTRKLLPIDPQTIMLDRVTSRLKGLVVNDQNMYDAMQNFLLSAPKRQIPLLGEVSSMLAKGNTARSNGNNLGARSDYETAAKMEIYNQNEASARSCLLLAEQVSTDQQHHKFQETMLADMPQVLRISKAYQAAPPG